MEHVLSLAHWTVVNTRSFCVNSPIARVRLAGKLEQARNEVAALREIIRITRARMARIPAKNRPHYPPAERLAILQLRAAQGWTLAETARVFQVADETLASWRKRLDADGDRLLELPTPVNRFPDFVACVVRALKAQCPLMGKRGSARFLARAGLHLAANTVRSLWRPRCRPRPQLGAGQSAEEEGDASPRIVTAKRPNHVWHVDLTVAPTSGGFWTSWLPFALPQRWPFCWWVAAVVDHFSRCAMGFALFPDKPTSAEVCSFLERLIATHGVSPKYIISDKGTQFRKHYMDWCDSRRPKIKWRRGKVGKRGSIAVIERFIRSLKDECTRRMLVPLDINEMRAELDLFLVWHNQFRPHSFLNGATPAEVYAGRTPANELPRFEPRKRWPPGSRCANPQAPIRGDPGVRLELHVSFLEGRKHLPIVELREAA